MRTLVFGSNGFVGSNVCEVLQGEHEVHTTAPDVPEIDNNHPVDLLDSAAVQKVIETVSPEAIVNCAGIVDPTADVTKNETFTKNILEAIVASGRTVRRTIICGSAGAYGLVPPSDLPVKETQALAADSAYGRSKIDEERFALTYGEAHDLTVVVCRIFNPIGTGMKPRFITSRIIEQIAQIKKGERDSIELSRLDAERDYIGIRDVARAIKSLLEATETDSVYNIGSGKSVSNEYLARKIAEYSGITEDVKIVGTADQPEPTVASQADISKIQRDTGWSPADPIDSILKEIVDAK